MFFTLFSSLVCITVQVLFTQPPNSNKLLTFPFLQPQMNPFYLYIKILKPHILSQRNDSWPSIIFYLVDLVKGPQLISRIRVQPQLPCFLGEKVLCQFLLYQITTIQSTEYQPYVTYISQCPKT